MNAHLQTTFLCRSPSTGAGEEGPEGEGEDEGSQGRGKWGEAGGLDWKWGEEGGLLGPGRGGKLRGRVTLDDPPPPGSLIRVSLVSLFPP